MFQDNQDTLKVNNLIQKVPELNSPKTLKIKSDRVIQSITKRDTQDMKTDSIVEESATAQTPTAAQLKYWWWQREQKLLIGNSRYVPSKNEIQLHTVTHTEQRDFALPNRLNKQVNYDWLTGILIAVLILFATVRHSYSKYLETLFHSVFNYSTASRMFQEKNYSFIHAAFRLEVYFYIILSVFVFQLFNYFNLSIPYKNIGLFIYSFGIVLGYFVLKKFIYRLLGIIVEGTTETSEYLFNMDNINRVTGLALFPVVLLLAFAPFHKLMWLIIIGAIVVVFLYFSLLSRGFLILMRKQFSIFYLFLYFCTLEFLPLVLFYKIVVL